MLLCKMNIAVYIALHAVLYVAIYVLLTLEMNYNILFFGFASFYGRSHSSTTQDPVTNN